MVKNVLALIGLYFVGKKAYEVFDEHLRVPMERVITDAIDDEKRRA